MSPSERSSEPTAEPARDFLCWRQGRDPGVLARVFDATASSLLLLAVHVTQDEHQAEELVQATFLAAMEAADRYEAGKPLLPWLGGILHNIARNQWRARARRREQGLGDEPHDTAAGPLEQLADRETTEHVMRVIGELPQHYRQVLNLRLVHGLKNVDIAHSLGIPVGTVRARVHRGLDILRAALPTGLASAMLVVLDGRGLAAVREAVVGKATALAAGTAAGAAAATASLSGASTFTGVLLMKKVALVAATAAALLLGWHYWPDEILDPPTAEGSKETAAAEPGPRAGNPEPAGPPSQDSRVALALDGQNANAKGLLGWHLHGIVRSGGAPLPGAAVRIEIERGGLHESLARVRTDSEGRYQVDLRSLQESPLLLLATSSIYARADAVGYWPGDSMFVSKELASLPATHVFTRDLAVTKGPTVTGRIVDPRGKPVAAAAVRVVERADKADRTPRKTDKAGRFEVAMPKTTGDLWVVAGKSDVGIASKSLGSVSTGTDVGDVQLQPHGTLSGEVVLEDGDAYPHAELIILHDGADEYAWTRGQCPRLADGVLFPHDALLVRCDAQGRFQVAGLRGGGYQVAVRRTLQPYANAQAQAGDDNIRIMVPGQLLTLRVTDQEKRPLPGALVVLTGWSGDQLSERGFAETSRPPAASLGPPSGHHTQAVRHPTGELHWILPPGSYWNIRHRVDHATPESRSWRVMRGVHRARVELVLAVDDSVGRLRIAVLDEVGNRVPEWQVSLRLPQTNGLVRSLQPSQLDADDHTPLLSAGRYLATIESGPRIGGQRPNVQLNTEVRVVAHRVMDWTVRVQRKGLLRLTLVPPDDLHPPERWHGLRVTVEPGGRDEEATFFGFFDQLTPDGKGHDTKTSPLVGRKLVCPGNLAPGRRVVKVSCRGFHDVLAPVDIRPGEVADLEVMMIPR